MYLACKMYRTTNKFRVCPTPLPPRIFVTGSISYIWQRGLGLSLLNDIFGRIIENDYVRC